MAEIDEKSVAEIDKKSGALQDLYQVFCISKSKMKTKRSEN
jgi:hypothetical protein